MEHIEIGISFKFVQEVHCQLTLGMSESAHISVVAHVHPVWIGLTELDFVLLRVIELFNSVVAPYT
jgi:hypothetical protein